MEWRIWQFAPRYPKFNALARAVKEFQRYINRNASIIPDYGARWRAGQVISTAFIESLVNPPLAKRFAKKTIHAVDARRRSLAVPDSHADTQR